MQRMRSWFSSKTAVEPKSAPGPKPWPLVGNAPQLDKDKFHVILHDWAGVYGDVFQLDVLGTKYLIINSPQLFQSMLRKHTNRPFHIADTMIYNGHGIDFTNREFFVDEAKRVVHHVESKDELANLFRTEVKAAVEELKMACGNEIELNSFLKKTIITQMLITILGCAPEDRHYEDLLLFFSSYREFFAGSAALLLTSAPWLRSVPGPFKWKFDASQKAMHVMVQGLMESVQNGKGNGSGIIENMMARQSALENDVDGKEKLVNDNISAFVVDILIGSIVPLSNNMTAILLCILKHPSVQESIHAELDKVCPTTSPTLDDRDNLHYLNAAILEGMRYSSVIAITVPHTTAEDTDIGGYSVEKGTHIYGNIFRLHHGESFGADPWVFRPERFLDESGKLIASDHPIRKTMVPFSTGRRTCTGYRFAENCLFKYISTMLYHFKIRPGPDGELPDCDPRTFRFGPALDVPEVRCSFEPRQ